MLFSKCCFLCFVFLLLVASTVARAILSGHSLISRKSHNLILNYPFPFHRGSHPCDSHPTTGNWLSLREVQVSCFQLAVFVVQAPSSNNFFCFLFHVQNNSLQLQIYIFLKVFFENSTTLSLKKETERRSDFENHRGGKGNLFLSVSLKYCVQVYWDAPSIFLPPAAS